jgi:alpha-amylase
LNERVLVGVGLVSAALFGACGASSGGVHGVAIDFDGGSSDGSASTIDAGDVRDASDDGSALGDAGSATRADPATWRAQVIYLALPDRFFNGDPSNDVAGAASCVDVTNASLFHGGDLAGLRRKIAYVKELGGTALWSTPFYAQVPLRNGACGYHGYWADYFDPDDGAMEPKLGTFADATALVSDLHANGMKLIVDMVVNHSGRGARITTEHADWFHDAATCAQLGDPKIYCSLNGLPDFAQENPIVAAYLTGMSKRWVESVMPDGIRMDTAQHVPASYFASSWNPGVRAAKGDLFTVGEVFDEGPYTNFLPELGSGFDSVFDFPLRRALVDALAKGGSLDLVATKVMSAISTWGLARTLMKTTMLDNHDVPRFLTEAGAGVLSAELASRYSLALTALFTLPGIPQLYYGDELGMLGAYPDNRRDMPDWAWDAAGRSAPHAGYLPSSQATFELTKTLARIRRENAALSDGYYAELWRPNGGTSNALAFFRGAGSSRLVVVIHNDAGASGSLALPYSNSANVTAADRAAWPEGTVLDDLLKIGAPPTLTLSGGKLTWSATGNVAGIYRAR